jgi:NACHT domain
MDIRFNNYNTEGIVEKILKKNLVFLVGESGIGKTYTIYRIMSYCIKKNGILPIFLSSEIFNLYKDESLENLIWQAYSSILEVQEIEELILELQDNKECLILIDAINEVDVKAQKNIFRFVSSELRKNNKILISGQKLLEEVLDIRIKNKMYIMEVTQINIHEEILKFAYECLRNEPEKIKKLNYIEKVDNTLLGVLIVYYLKKSDEISVRLTDLFKNVIVQILIFRAKKIDYIDYSLSINILSDLIYWHYMNDYKITKNSVKVWYEKNKDIIAMIFKYQVDFFEWIFRESIFKVNDEYVSLIHEKIGDFLVAYKIFNSLNFNEYQDLVNINLFKKDITIKISTFLTDFLLYEDITINFRENLRRIYTENIRDNLNYGIIYRQQAAFYLGLLGDDIEKFNYDSMVVKRANIVGKAISGYEIDKFKSYCHELVNNSKEEIVNLCYTLIHQGDYVSYNENEFEVFDLKGIECENAFKGMIKQLLKQEYKRIDILAIMTINDYYSLFGTSIDIILSKWYNWNTSIKPSLIQSIKQLEQIYETEIEMYEEIVKFKKDILKVSN